MQELHPATRCSPNNNRFIFYSIPLGVALISLLQLLGVALALLGKGNGIIYEYTIPKDSLPCRKFSLTAHVIVTKGRSNSGTLNSPSLGQDDIRLAVRQIASKGQMNQNAIE